MLVHTVIYYCTASVYAVYVLSYTAKMLTRILLGGRCARAGEAPSTAGGHRHVQGYNG